MNTSSRRLISTALFTVTVCNIPVGLGTTTVTYPTSNPFGKIAPNPEATTVSLTATSSSRSRYFHLAGEGCFDWPLKMMPTRPAALDTTTSILLVGSTRVSTSA